MEWGSERLVAGERGSIIGLNRSKFCVKGLAQAAGLVEGMCQKIDDQVTEKSANVKWTSKYPFAGHGHSPCQRQSRWASRRVLPVGTGTAFTAANDVLPGSGQGGQRCHAWGDDYGLASFRGEATPCLGAAGIQSNNNDLMSIYAMMIGCSTGTAGPVAGSLLSCSAA